MRLLRHSPEGQEARIEFDPRRDIASEHVGNRLKDREIVQRRSENVRDVWIRGTAGEQSTRAAGATMSLYFRTAVCSPRGELRVARQNVEGFRANREGTDEWGSARTLTASAMTIATPDWYRCALVAKLTTRAAAFERRLQRSQFRERLFKIVGHRAELARTRRSALRWGRLNTKTKPAQASGDDSSANHGLPTPPNGPGDQRRGTKRSEVHRPFHRLYSAALRGDANYEACATVPSGAGAPRSRPSVEMSSSTSGQ